MTPETVEIVCPRCQVRLSVTNSKHEDVKRIVCPQCGKQMDIRFRRPKSEDGATQLGGVPTGGETQLGGAVVHPMSCHLMLNGKRYDLQIGRNTIGRKAKTSTADVQLDTDDLFMSRQHAIINVRRLPNGGITTSISNDQNKNATLVNNMELAKADEIVLNDGDQIKMGETIVTFLNK